MYNKTVIHEDEYEIHNDVSSLYHEIHQHSSRKMLKQLNNLKQVRFDSSPPEVFEYEALDPENLLNDNYYQINFNNKSQGISNNDSFDFSEIENHSNIYENELSRSENNPLTLPIPNRKEIFELENYPSDLNQNNNFQIVEPLKAEDILSIDGKFIQKTKLSDKIYDSSSEQDSKFTLPNDNWINLKDIRLEIDKISVNKESNNGFSNNIISKDHPTTSDQFNNPDFFDMQSTTESLSFL
ncbi:uncharacterized protein cubi_00416 [Cryptosporidium ubiquitum]|uniref:Uncharacterized protein n=1 Tax=Cryptosporidium ubiquitum TaxID=857276 RepID=A0A1J4MHW7_9CRYT|nr:uncharacterized protein cubi_00416 [Cryptosporidium ubiquitum]OII72421.1 hypothetical protein cubi_00416 [Cryptosporidium ubiquitum]